MKTIVLGIMMLMMGALWGVPSVYASSYSYEAIDAEIIIHEDTTFTVRETQTYRFDGEFHKGWREIPLRGLSTVTDIVVYDGQTGRPLVFTPDALEKTEPTAWGKYTYRIEAGKVEIEWYYNAQNETKTWILEYTVIGGISFLANMNELYWNILTDYNVPIARSLVTLTLPTQVPESNLQITEYLEGGAFSSSTITSGSTATAEAYQLRPGAKFTVAFGFPEGVIDRGAFWKYLLQTYLPYILALLLWIGTILFSILYWYYSERHNTGRGTVIAEYEPPQGLPPAVGECIVKEKKTAKTWPATLVDLAVRGFVRFEEEEKQSYLFQYIFVIAVILFFGWQFFSFFLYTFSGQISDIKFNDIPFLLAIIFLGFFFFRVLRIKLFFEQKEYKIIQLSDADTHTLRPYEKRLLDILFSNKIDETTRVPHTFGELLRAYIKTPDVSSSHIKANKLVDSEKVFSTRAMKKASDITKLRIAKSFEKLEKEFYTEMASYGFHTHSIQTEKTAKILLIVCIAVMFWLSIVFSTVMSHWLVVVSSLVGCIAIVVYMVRYEVKLTKQGAIEKEKWLGFKEFLYRTERYRVQNLTPDMFQKFLPYAMVFGIEKRWAKHFESIAITTPEWYRTAPSSRNSFTSSSMAGSFSAGAFSASLSSSFASAFSTSSGSSRGASGGGGRAGGGGGGGGGGAS
jgi:uncharacterized membrane protein YgcG